MSAETALPGAETPSAASLSRISAAARADYAEAAAVVLAGQDTSARIHELAGDTSYSLAELAGEISRKSGKEVIYRNLAQDEYKNNLAAAGLPEAFAAMLADSDAGAARGREDARVADRVPDAQPGEPRPVEGAAGSRYVEVPLLLRTTHADGSVRTLSVCTRCLRSGAVTKPTVRKQA